jgi:hypothetical protein
LKGFINIKPNPRVSIKKSMSQWMFHPKKLIFACGYVTRTDSKAVPSGKEGSPG